MAIRVNSVKLLYHFYRTLSTVSRRQVDSEDQRPCIPVSDKASWLVVWSTGIW